jgi:hypothetical protein
VMVELKGLLQQAIAGPTPLPQEPSEACTHADASPCSDTMPPH